jgi:predicted transposase/invertase (TIGR01784 family)
MIQEAYCKLQAMSDDEANRMIYEARLKAQRDEYSRIQGALQKGREQGLQQGLRQGREEIILQMTEHGMDVKAIAGVTHLSEREINDILNK